MPILSPLAKLFVVFEYCRRCGNYTINAPDDRATIHGDHVFKYEFYLKDAGAKYGEPTKKLCPTCKTEQAEEREVEILTIEN